MYENIFFGPWIGEFGYEQLYWLGECKRIREDFYPQCRAAAASFPGRKILYDFVDEFIPHALRSLSVSSHNGPLGSNVSVSPRIAEYMARPNTLIYMPGSSFIAKDATKEGVLKLGGAHGHRQLELSMEFQKIVRPKPSDGARKVVQRVIRDRPFICIFCRAHNEATDPSSYYSLTESCWKETIKRLIDSGYLVVCLSRYYPAKPSFLKDFEMPGFMNIGRDFEEYPEYVDLQLAFLHRTVLTISSPCGANHLIYKTPSKFLYLIEYEGCDRLPLMEACQKKYNAPIRYLGGHTGVKDISVDRIFEAAICFIRNENATKV